MLILSCRVFQAASAVALALLVSAGTGAAADRGPDEALFRSIYRELVELNTTESSGDTLIASQAMAARLIAAGWAKADVHVLSSGPRKGNLVARLRGKAGGNAGGKPGDKAGRRPLLLVAHIDVVEARREDWAFDPFKLQEVDGYFRGRGTVDDKAMAAIFVSNLIRYRAEGLKPERDIILALTTDEELADSPHNGMRWLLDNHRSLIDAELAINEGGGGVLRNGRPVSLHVQHAEKVYRSFRLEVKDPGGHSATPRRDNAIYRLAEGLGRLARFEFPARLNPVTSGYFAREARDAPPAIRAAIMALAAGNAAPEVIAPLAGRPAYNAQIRTTCVATMVEAGHAENALPQTARATVNCRLLPDEQPAFVAATLQQVMADERVAVIPLGDVVESPASPMSPALMSAVETISARMWPGVPVTPTQSGGYTDSRWLRRAGIPTYGVSGLFTEEGKSGTHGLDEHVGVNELFAAKAFLHALVKRLAGP